MKYGPKPFLYAEGKKGFIYKELVEMANLLKENFPTHIPNFVCLSWVTPPTLSWKGYYDNAVYMSVLFTKSNKTKNGLAISMAHEYAHHLFNVCAGITNVTDSFWHEIIENECQRFAIHMRKRMTTPIPKGLYDSYQEPTFLFKMYEVYKENYVQPDENFNFFRDQVKENSAINPVLTKAKQVFLEEVLHQLQPSLGKFSQESSPF